MAVPVSFLTVLSVALTALTAFLLWLRFHFIASSLDVPELQKALIRIVSAVLLFGWFFLVLAFAWLDLFHVTSAFISPAVPLGFMLPLLVGGYLLKNSSIFQSILDRVSQEWLILVQIYRAGGIVFIFLFMQQQLPALFAIPAGIGDLLVGGSAPLVAYYYSKKKTGFHTLAMAWNAIGILDLIVAISVGIVLALPDPFRLVATAPSTEPMTVFPLVLIPVFAVPLGLLLHVFSLRLLLKEKKLSSAN